MTDLQAYVCHNCGYDGFKAGTTEAAGMVGPMQWFCPVCETELVRADILGDIEAKEGGLRKFNPDDYDGIIKAKL